MYLPSIIPIVLAILATPASPLSIPNLGLTSFPASSFFNNDQTQSIIASLKQNIRSSAFTTSFGSGNVQGTKDPLNSAPGSSSVLKVHYPKGSVNPQNTPVGGVGFYLPFPESRVKSLGSIDEATLSYSILFPKDFDFVKGGKLPGFYGGDQHCSGGSKSQECFSMRMMWRGSGKGEAYAYVPQEAVKQDHSLCSGKGNYCNPDYGTSIQRGAFSFPTDTWTNVAMTVKLNSNSSTCDGSVDVSINEKRAIHFPKLCYRGNQNIPISGVMFDTFFGGSSDAYRSTKDTDIYFKNITISAGNLPSLKLFN
ncbi:MAG: hypothetical protein DHS80DRAFT_28350 [Piptocephalis tieghemiana]|nr:MAG: hypothetical protein DHS80DRAFT_28350 [Piptocephalis tieghemiana]